jgi:hypothetical protein
MSVDVSTSILINRSRDMVSGHAANPDHAPEWLPPTPSSAFWHGASHGME